MARKKKDNPTNMAADDVASTLVSASGDLIEAQEGLEAARQPIRDAKAQIKATGIDFDIFKLCHGIRHLDDDGARQKRIGKLQIAVHALLGDRVQLDMFGFVAQIKPAVKEALRDASDTLRKEEPEAAAEPQDQDLPFDPPSVPEPEEAAEDIPALVAAESMPEGAGFAFNNGLQAGRLGHDADANPHAADTPEAKLWEDGRQRGAALGPVEEEPEAIEHPVEPSANSVVEFTGTSEQKRIQAYFFGYDNATQNALPALTKGRRGEIKARIEAGFVDQSEGKDPRYPRPSALAPQDAPVEAATPETAPDAEAAADPVEEVEPARVDVREIDGKPMLFDLLAGSPLMDVSSLRTGETWATQINEFFADRLDSVTRAELIDAAKTLARGRMLMAPAPGTPPAYDLRSAV